MDASMNHELGHEAPGAGYEKLTTGLQERGQVHGAWLLPAYLAAGFAHVQELGKQASRGPGPSLAGLAKPQRNPEWGHYEGLSMTGLGLVGAGSGLQRCTQGSSGHPVRGTARWRCSLNLVHYKATRP